MTYWEEDVKDGDYDKLSSVAARIITDMKGHPHVLFDAEMGCGKTTLIAEILRLLGVKTRVSSPTYSIVNEHVLGDDIIYHFDLYRLKNEELYDIGFEDYLEGGSTVFVEWPGLAMDFFSAGTLIVKIVMNGTDRVIRLHEM